MKPKTPIQQQWKIALAELKEEIEQMDGDPVPENTFHKFEVRVWPEEGGVLSYDELPPFLPKELSE